MHKRINYLIICCISIFFLCGNKCHEKQLGYCNLSPQDLQINPYNGNELIKFQNLSGDSLQFLVGSRVSNITKKYSPNQDEYSCNYYMFETNNMVISSNSNSWQFSIILHSYPTGTSNIYDKVIEFQAFIPEQSKNSFSQRYLLFEQDTITGNQYSVGPDLIYHTSLTLGLKSFTNVYEITLGPSDVKVDYWVNKIYFTIKQGIVGFSTNQNELWYLRK
jgi:hypothetical protein